MHPLPNSNSQNTDSPSGESNVSTPEIDVLRQNNNPVDPQRRVISGYVPPDTSEEVMSFSEKTLKENAARRAFDRDQKWQDHFARAFICTFWFLWFSFCVMIGILIYHWVAPAEYSWLTPEQLGTLKTIIAAALASKVISVQQEKLSTSKE